MKGKKQKEPVGFNPAEIFAALALLEKERGIPQSFMMEKIVQALTTAYKRDHADVENVIVDVDEAHQNLKMFVQKNVVEEEDYVDPANEMPIEEAKRLSAKYEVGDIVNIPVDTVEFGRIAAGNGKQVIIQGRGRPSGARCMMSSTPSSMRSSPAWSPVWIPATAMCPCGSAPAPTLPRRC